MKKTTVVWICVICVLVIAVGAVSAVLFDAHKNRQREEAANRPAQPGDRITVAEKIDLLISDMTIEEKVGQMFFVRCPRSQAALDVSKYCLGGYVLFARDFDGKNAQQVQSSINDYQRAASVPLLIGVDEEGGTVVRVSSNKNLADEPFLSPQEVYASGGFDAVAADTKKKAELLLELGINMNLAPVADVSTDEADFIHDRAFGKDAEETAEYVKTVVTEMKKARIASCLKHFPGYGNNADTHTGVAVDERSLSSLRSSDFVPFTEGIKAGADSVLVSHNIVEAIDKDMPASLSKRVHNVLRNELDFSGVIMTDDLAMDAIGEYAKPGEAAVLAVLAGNDMILASDYQTQIPAVIAAVNEGRIKEEQLDQSVRRILNLKASLGLIK